MEPLHILAIIAANLTTALGARDRFQQLLDTMRLAIPYDAAALLRVEGDSLRPIAANGLTADAMGREFKRHMHPRLDRICRASGPILFAHDEQLPDPFTGLLLHPIGATSTIHACLGCPLHVSGSLVGVLTADAFSPGAFDRLPPEFLMAVGSMAGAQLQTVDLLNALEAKAERQGQIASDLMENVLARGGRDILGNSKKMEKLRQEIALVAGSGYNILILGETGVGKELVVRNIHRQSQRQDRPMLYLNCAALPEGLAESELFGHVKGAFTGAVSDRTGKFELADTSTLFLDEIGELPLEIQAKLLRAIQEGEIQRVGSEKTIKVDVRLLAATNRDLDAEVAAGRFRADLFHRLNVYPLTVPPLRERKEDIAILAGHFCEKSMTRLGLGPVRIGDDALGLLHRYSWPGNVRELENIISRAVLKASRDHQNGLLLIRADHIVGDFGSTVYSSTPDQVKQEPDLRTTGSLRDEVKALQIRLIHRAVARNSGNWAAAARDLEMDRSNLHNLAKRLGIRRTDSTSPIADN